MLPKNCGQLLFNAVRETLETMAFAEVTLCSIKVGDEEFSQDEAFAAFSSTATDPVINNQGEAGWGDVPVAATPDAWGSAVPDALPPEDAWGVPADVPLPNDGWGDQPVDEEEEEWGKSGILLPSKDPWGESAAMAAGAPEAMANMAPREADFEEMATREKDWVWACMKVNSPDIHAVWFVVTKGLANSLAMNMYAGEAFELDNPLIRDLIAELTNVLGGRLMLLLEEMGGKFTLTVPEIGFGMPEIPNQGLENAVCKVVVDGEHPIIAALCFNPGGIVATGA